MEVRRELLLFVLWEFLLVGVGNDHEWLVRTRRGLHCTMNMTLISVETSASLRLTSTSRSIIVRPMAVPTLSIQLIVRSTLLCTLLGRLFRELLPFDEELPLDELDLEPHELELLMEDELELLEEPESELLPLAEAPLLEVLELFGLLFTLLLGLFRFRRPEEFELDDELEEPVVPVASALIGRKELALEMLASLEQHDEMEMSEVPVHPRQLVKARPSSLRVLCTVLKLGVSLELDELDELEELDDELSDRDLCVRLTSPSWLISTAVAIEAPVRLALCVPLVVPWTVNLTAVVVVTTVMTSMTRTPWFPPCTIAP